jgi:hypothetical protein
VDRVPYISPRTGAGSCRNSARAGDVALRMEDWLMMKNYRRSQI